MKKTHFLVLLFSCAIFTTMSTCTPKNVKNESQSQSSTESIRDDDYYRNNYFETDTDVKNNDADSIVVRSFVLTKEDGKIVKGELRDESIYIINRGDTILYSKYMMDASSYTILSDDHRHVSSIVRIDSDGDESTEYETEAAPNLRIRKQYRNNVVSSSVEVEYFKDKLVEKFFFAGEEKPHTISTVTFDELNRVIETSRKSDLGDRRVENRYDENGVLTKLINEYTNDPYGGYQLVSIDVETKLNDRGDWLERVYKYKGKIINLIEREIFYK